MPQLLIYENAVPISWQRHANRSIEAGKDYSFSRSVNSVPVMTVEVPAASAEYAVVFAGSGDAMVPAVILGLRSDENLFLDAQGGWRARYIPAFVRRYPFVFSSTDGGRTYTLCVDESFKGFNDTGAGERLFGADGKPTAYVENVLKFVQQYQLEATRTQAFCKKLQSLDLLQPMQAQVRTAGGEQLSLSGFSVVDRARLKALPDAAVLELFKSDELELIHAHLASLRNFADMNERLGAPAVG